jgi:hypothetical protein
VKLGHHEVLLKSILSMGLLQEDYPPARCSVQSFVPDGFVFWRHSISLIFLTSLTSIGQGNIEVIIHCLEPWEEPHNFGFVPSSDNI